METAISLCLFHSKPQIIFVSISLFLSIYSKITEKKFKLDFPRRYLQQVYYTVENIKLRIKAYLHSTVKPRRPDDVLLWDITQYFVHKHPKSVLSKVEFKSTSVRAIFGRTNQITGECFVCALFNSEWIYLHERRHLIVLKKIFRALWLSGDRSLVY